MAEQQKLFSSKISLQKLEQWLWDAACSIRGLIDAPKFKDYILPLLFFKRLSDVFEDELKRVMKIKLKGTRTHSKHMDISRLAELKRIKPRVFKPKDPTLPGEINNVDIDMENAKLAENQILYNYALKFASFEKYKAVISGNPQ